MYSDQIVSTALSLPATSAFGVPRFRLASPNSSPFNEVSNRWASSASALRATSGSPMPRSRASADFVMRWLSIRWRPAMLIADAPESFSAST
ncbi:MAG: hypothetical protein AAGB93_06960 [Planctomycetota bacterium]